MFIMTTNGENKMNQPYEKAAKIIKNSKSLIALTGAGISVESGIPDFRGPNGLWERFDPMEYAHIDSFRNDPVKIWKMLFILTEIVENAKPNAAHIALARLEEMGLIKAIITQNIDNLHQAAGSKEVIEFHGNASHLDCIFCGSRYKSNEFQLKGTPPECPDCGKILKPGAVFFGEMIPQVALIESNRLASAADVILVIGTSAVIYPAASIPYTAKTSGAYVIEINLEQTGLTSSIPDIFLEGEAGKILPMLVECAEHLSLFDIAFLLNDFEDRRYAEALFVY